MKYFLHFHAIHHYLKKKKINQSVTAYEEFVLIFFSYESLNINF